MSTLSITNFAMIRAAELADARAVMRLLNQLNEEEGNAVKHSIADVEALINKTLRAESAEQSMQVYSHVAQHDSEIIGVVIGYQGFDVLSMQLGMHVADIIVDAGWRGQGVGRKLLRTLADENQKLGGAWMSLTSAKRNKVGDKFYRALGFHAIDVQFFAIGEKGIGLL